MMRDIGLYPWAYCPGCKRPRRLKRFEDIYWIHNRPDRTLCGFSGQTPWHSYRVPYSRYSSPAWWEKIPAPRRGDVQ